jgi:cytochrome c5
MRWYRRVSLNVSALAFALACASLTGCDDDKDADKPHDDSDAHTDEAAAGAGAHDAHTHDATTMVGPLTGATCPADNKLTYDNFGKGFIATYCLTCHSTSVTGDKRNGAPPDHNFDKLSDVDLLSMHIDEYAGSGPASTNTHMPPKGSKAPSDDERAKLSQWIACKVPENDSEL